MSKEDESYILLDEEKWVVYDDEGECIEDNKIEDYVIELDGEFELGDFNELKMKFEFFDMLIKEGEIFEKNDILENDRFFERLNI